MPIVVERMPIFGSRIPTTPALSFLAAVRSSELKGQLPMLSSGSRASTPLKKEADSIRAKLEELGEDAAEVCVCVCVCVCV